MVIIMKDYKKIRTMNNEIKTISKYRALMIGKYYMTLCLILSFFILGYQNYTDIPVYILLFLYILPPVLSFALRDYIKRYNIKILQNISNITPFILSTLKKKYCYSRVNNISNSISFFIALILLSLWQYNYYNISDRISIFCLYSPAIILVSSVLIRYSSIIFYYFKLSYDLKNNKV
jgi:hypothetical protein